MPWSENQPGVYERSIGENEQFIKLIGDRAHGLGREHWSVTSSAEFQLLQPCEDEDLVNKCRLAWQNLRFSHPSIASQAEGSRLLYKIPDKTDLESWTNNKFYIHRGKVMFEDLLASFKPDQVVAAHLLLHERMIVLHFPHWRTDGYGALLLVDAFLRNLAGLLTGSTKASEQQAWGQEACRLVPSVEEVIGLPEEATLEVVEQARKYLATAAFLHGAVGMETSAGTEASLPKGTRGVNVRLSQSDTKLIEKACLEKGITQEAAVQASCSTITYLEAAEDQRQKPYTSTMRFSLRPFMPAPWDGAEYASALCTGGYLEQVPASNTWLDNAKHYTQKYDIGITQDFLHTRRQYAKECLKALSQTPPPRPPASSEIDISSVGDAEKLVTPEYTDENGAAVIQVQNVSIGVETLSRQIYCFMWTYHGQLELRLVYNEAFYDVARMQRIVEGLQKVLLENLCI